MPSRADALAASLFALASLGFVAVTAVLVVGHAVYAPYWDHWTWLARYLDAPHLSDVVLTPANGHLLVLPSLFYVADLELFHGSGASLVVTLLLSTGVICLLLIAPFVGLPGPSSLVRVVFAGGVSTAFLWLYNWENLLWPFQIHQYLSSMFALGGLLLLAHASVGGPGGPARFLAGLLCGVVSTFSFGSGIAFWPAALMMLLAQRQGAARIGSALMCGVLAVTPFALVVAVEPDGGPGTSAAGLVRYVVLFLGSPAVHGGRLRTTVAEPSHLWPAYLAGGVALALCLVPLVACLRRPREQRSTPEVFYWGVMLSAAATAVLTAVARAEHPLPAQALSSRYGVTVLQAWSAIFALALLRTRRFHALATFRGAFGAASLLVLAFLAVSQYHYLVWWKEWRREIRLAELALIVGAPDADRLGYVFVPGRSEVVLRVSETLRRRRLSLFARDEARLLGRSIAEWTVTSSDACRGAFENVVAGSDGLVRVAGWAWSAGGRGGAPEVLLVDGPGTVVGFATMGRIRRDVTARLDLADGVLPGWDGYVAPSAGKAELSALLDVGGGVLCPLGSARRSVR